MERGLTKLYRSLTPGGWFWAVDLSEHETREIQQMMWWRHEEYLRTLGGEELRTIVVNEVLQQDTPRPLLLQLDLLRKVGFRSVEILHKNSCFAAFGAMRPEQK